LNSSLKSCLMLLMLFILRFFLYKKIIYIVRVSLGWTDPELLGPKTDPHSTSLEISKPRTDPVSLKTGPRSAGLGRSRVDHRPMLTPTKCQVSTRHKDLSNLLIRCKRTLINDFASQPVTRSGYTKVRSQTVVRDRKKSWIILASKSEAYNFTQSPFFREPRKNITKDERKNWI